MMRLTTPGTCPCIVFWPKLQPSHPSLALTPSEDRIAFVTPYALCSDWYRVMLFPTVKFPCSSTTMEPTTAWASATWLPSCPTAASKPAPEAFELIVTSDWACNLPSAPWPSEDLVTPSCPLLLRSAKPTVTPFFSPAAPYALAARATSAFFEFRRPASVFSNAEQSCPSLHTYSP